MNIQNLRYVLEIIELGSVSAAARKLFISQSYLSKILMEVEREYEITIFVRERNNLVLTEQGGAFALRTREILDEIDNYDQQLHHLHSVNHLSFSSCQTSFVSDAYVDFLSLHPDMQLRIEYRENGNNTVIHDVYTKASEFGVVVFNNSEFESVQGMLIKMNLIWEKLYDLQFHVIVRVGHPLTRLSRPIQIEDLYAYNLILYPQHRSLSSNTVGTAQYEYNFSQIDWNNFRQITYIQSRAQYRELIQQTDAVSFGFQSKKNQETLRGLVSLTVSQEFIQSLSKDINSSLYCIRAKDHALSPLAAELVQCLKDSDDWATL